MTRFVIGDLHGCIKPLQRLLVRLGADTRRDRFHFLGDLVNRGPDSLATLRFVRDLGDRATVVLGNHDLHLLAVLNGIRDPSKKDTLDTILRAPDRDELADWLRSRSLLETDAAAGHVRVHAGIHPLWSLPEAQRRADEVERMLRRKDYRRFLAVMYGNEPRHPDRAVDRVDRLRCSVNVFTRMRYCLADGTLDFQSSRPPAGESTLQPWYRVPDRQDIGYPILFGHWSAHPAMAPAGIVPMDRGCVWGGTLAGMPIGAGAHAVAVDRRSVRRH